MGDNTPRNPIFNVDPAAYEVCLPKVVCSACGTIIGLRKSHHGGKVRCPECESLLEIKKINGGFDVTVLEQGTDDPPQAAEGG